MGTFVAGVAAEAAAYAGGLGYMMLQGGRDAVAVGIYEFRKLPKGRACLSMVGPG